MDRVHGQRLDRALAGAPRRARESIAHARYLMHAPAPRVETDARSYDLLRWCKTQAAPPPLSSSPPSHMCPSKLCSPPDSAAVTHGLAAVPCARGASGRLPTGPAHHVALAAAVHVRDDASRHRRRRAGAAHAHARKGMRDQSRRLDPGLHVRPRPPSRARGAWPRRCSIGAAAERVGGDGGVDGRAEADDASGAGRHGLRQAAQVPKPSLDPLAQRSPPPPAAAVFSLLFQSPSLPTSLPPSLPPSHPPFHPPPALLPTHPPSLPPSLLPPSLPPPTPTHRPTPVSLAILFAVEPSLRRLSFLLLTHWCPAKDSCPP